MSLIINSPKNLLRKTGVAFALCLSAWSVSANENYVVSGEAFDLKNNKLIYREYYSPMNENNEVTVTYAKPNGKVFATKTLFYTGEVTQPEFELHDKRDDEKVSARFVSGRLVLSHSLNFATDQTTVMDNASLVIDAGFDAFIQKNWDKLTSGKKVLFDFALPSQVMTIKLQAQEVSAEKSLVSTSTSAANWRYFLITPANKFKSIFATPIHLAYSPENKYLMRFQGRSNLDSDKGDPLNVRIEYEYR